MLKQQDQTTSHFNAQQNTAKSLLALQGILRGLVADKSLNELEVIFLDTWLKSHEALPNEGEKLDLLDSIDSILADGIVTNDELEDLKSQVNDVLDYGVLVPACVEDLTNELLGMISGITADDVITIEELDGLIDWLNANPEVFECWPGNVLYNKITEILADNIVEPEELADLTQTCKMIAGQQFLETGVAGGMSTEFCAQPLEDLPSHVETICFTGKFLSGSRKALHAQAEELGIKPLKDVTQALDILVIGSLASRDWRFSSHGRKIEQALLNQQKGCNTLIITEDNWSVFTCNGKTN